MTEQAQGVNVAEQQQPPTRDTKVRRYLEQFRGRPVHRVPLINAKGKLVGNNGDTLMWLGTDRVERELEFEPVDRPESAELIVIGGSGGMLEKMETIPRLFAEVCERFPETPVCVLPSSYHYPNRPMSELIGERRAETMLFCREPFSYRHLTEEQSLPAGCRVELDDDMAFELESEPAVVSRRAMHHSSVLMVERTDVEHASVAMQSKKLGLRAKVSRKLPDGVKKALYPLLNRARAARSTPFREKCETLLREHHGEFVQARRDVADVSNVNTCDFDAFCDRIAQAHVVFTTRLHVGIYAAMVGRPTYIFDGVYHKIRGIYDQSLRQRPGITLVPKEAV